MLQKIIALLRPEVQQFIHDHAGEDEKTLLLKQKIILGLPVAWIAEQMAGRRRAKDKLPVHYRTSSILYPASLAMEQSSSELTAEFKASFLASAVHFHSTEVLGVDLTGGLGIDSLFLSRICDRFDYIEILADLLEIAKHNHPLMGATNIAHHIGTAEIFLKSTHKKFDFVFIDPSRRNHGQKVFKLSDTEPAITKLLPLIFEKTDTLLLKASPMLDLQQGILELRGAEKVLVVSVNNECKEVLFLCKETISKEPQIHCVNLFSGGSKTEEFIFTFGEEKKAQSVFSAPLGYLYEPNASILRAGAFKLAGLKSGLLKLHPHTHLYTSDKLVSNFTGRIFRIETLDGNLRKIKDYLPDNKANIITRNYPLRPEELKKKLKLKDGGEKYVLAFSGIRKKFLAVATRLK